jgi:RecA/RadA recombinase
MAKKPTPAPTEAPAKKTNKKAPTAAKEALPTLDVQSLFSASLDEISKRQGFEASSLDVAPPISSGMLAVDMILGGGIRPCMMTGVAQEQAGKTTLALTTMGSAIRANVPIIAFADYEGCFTADTLLGYGKGKHARLDELFDLSSAAEWKPGTWVGQVRHDIDTVEPGHAYGGTGVRQGELFYRGIKPTTTVTLSTGHQLTGYRHPMFVFRKGRVAVLPHEELQIGDQVLVGRQSRAHPLRVAGALRTFELLPPPRSGENAIPFTPTFELLVDYDLSSVTSVLLTGLTAPVFDVSLAGVSGDILPHSIITNGIVTHNSTKNSKPYVHSILKGMGVNLTMDEVFGKKSKDGKWEIAPRVRYRAESILERFYDWLSEILRELPDKLYVEEKWWLRFEDNKKNKAKVADFVDAGMTRKYGNGLWVPAPDDKIQALIIVDSYTAMQPEVKDEESISNQLSVKASAFSKQLERVKGRMAQKMVTVYGLNHLRDNPMAMYGPKETEKGGKALQQFCFAAPTLLITSQGMLRASEMGALYAENGTNE